LLRRCHRDFPRNCYCLLKSFAETAVNGRRRWVLIKNLVQAIMVLAGARRTYDCWCTFYSLFSQANFSASSLTLSNP
jgi:hypothetical protein